MNELTATHQVVGPQATKSASVFAIDIEVGIVLIGCDQVIEFAMVSETGVPVGFRSRRRTPIFSN